ncbi:endomucin isoform X1 [Harpia harpyja]|uniref:endomucin isoform X1 n=1 Tax=Harpia harpyja TaxID=202280 RepID=UPI0022B10E28|nr:endomucin isoform X1 [Harpia harpyja]
MKLLGIAAFFLAVLCVCTVGEDGTPASPISATTSTPTTKDVMEAVSTSTLQSTSLQMSVLTTTENRTTNESITSDSTSSSPNATQQITQDTTTQLPVKAMTTTAEKSDSTTNTTQASVTQLTHSESLDASSTKRQSFSSTISLQKTTSAPGTSGLHVRSPTESTTFGSTGTSSGNKNAAGSDIHYSSVILPIVITLIVITLSVFSLVALYRMCQKKTPERQENGTEQAQSDKEGVKLLSVKTTSPETVFVEVRDIYEVGFSLPSANLSEPTTPPPSGEVSQGRITGKGGHVALATLQLTALC